MSQVCGSCKSVVVRSDRGLENLGRVADVVTTDRGLAVHDRGNFRGRNFEVYGKLTLAHPAGGNWDEYYVMFDGRDPGWIEEAQGRFTVVTLVPAAQVQAPHPSTLQVQGQVALGAMGAFVITEVGQGTFLSADGELPFAARPGTLRKFADLSGANGMCAQIDYGDGSGAGPSGTPRVYVGYEVELAALNVQRVGIGARGQAIKSKDTKCPSCGGPLPLASGQSERIACKYCGALSDLETNQVIAQQGKARQEPWIPLGAKGVIENVEWTCIGYMHRSTEIDGESFSWSEYLLYTEAHGYRWLVLDEGVVRFGSNLPAGQVDVRGLPNSVNVRGANYQKRNGNTARVDYVLGEFYWKVAIGESAWAEDFEHGRYMISSERVRSGTQDEINWTFSQTIPRDIVENAFGIRGRTGAFGDPGVAPVAFQGFQGGRGMNGLVMAIIVIFVLLVFIGACSSACGGGGGSSYGGPGVRIGGGSSGGFGGK